MKTIFLAALLLNLAMTPSGWSAAAKHKLLTPIEREFAGLGVDSTGYPTNLTQAFAQGQANARRDLTNGVMATKSAGLPAPWADEYDALLKKRYHVQTDWLAGCCVTDGLMKYIRGYNEVSEAYIQQKYGTNIFDDLVKEVETKRNGKRIGDLSPSPAWPGFYIVQDGDTLTKIARKEGVTLKNLQDVNPGLAPNKLKIGQRIVVDVLKTNSVPKSLPAAN